MSRAPSAEAAARWADLVVLAHRGGVEGGDAQAAGADLLDQPVALQQRHRLLDRLARHAEPRRQFLLHEVGAGGQGAVADLVEQGLVGLLGTAGGGWDRLHGTLNSEFHIPWPAPGQAATGHARYSPRYTPDTPRRCRLRLNRRRRDGTVRASSATGEE